jgi:hypothetical protein
MNKDKAYRHNLRIELQRKEIIEDIKTEMIINNAQEINLHSGIIFNYIDDQTNEVIGGVTLDEKVFIDSGHDMDTVSLQDLSTDQLICLLEVIENKEFEVEELVEEK